MLTTTGQVSVTGPVASAGVRRSITRAPSVTWPHATVSAGSPSGVMNRRR